VGFSTAYIAIDAGIGALILFGGVQLTMFAGAVLAGEAMAARRWIGAALAMAGLAWLVWPAGAVVLPLPAVLAMLARRWAGGSIRSWGGARPTRWRRRRRISCWPRRSAPPCCWPGRGRGRS
jgi:hypothetical protein